MKKYMDIEALREFDEAISDGVVKRNNASAFCVGDHIQITEKYDGSNASIENIGGVIHSFSRNNELGGDIKLNGFYEYAKGIEKSGRIPREGIVIFGEWSGARNRIVYDTNHVWLVFDMFDRSTETWMPQCDVKKICDELDLQYINELYDGPFVSWEHCRSFGNSPSYGKKQEGVVVKNQDRLSDSYNNFYLKIVNQDFKEVMRTKHKVVDEVKVAESKLAMDTMRTIVTEPRVLKALFKMRDDGIVPSELTPKDMGNIAKHLPKMIWDDCVKEEPETVLAAGKLAGKACTSISMDIARSLVL